MSKEKEELGLAIVDGPTKDVLMASFNHQHDADGIIGVIFVTKDGTTFTGVIDGLFYEDGSEEKFKFMGTFNGVKLCGTYDTHFKTGVIKTWNIVSYAGADIK